MVMVRPLMHFGRNGLADWMVQRVSALILTFFTLYVLVCIGMHPHRDFLAWQAWFHGTGMRVFTLLAWLAFLAHTWVGMWTVFTDYIKPFFLRVCLQAALIVLLVAYFIWMLAILWL